MEIQDLTDEQIRDCYHRIERQVAKSIRFEDVEDLVQEVWIRALKSLHKLKEQSKFETWVYRITRAAIADYYQVNQELWRAYHYVVPVRMQKAEEASPDAMIIMLDLMKKAEEGERKPRSVFFYHFFGGYNQVEIARGLGAPYWAIHGQYARGLKRIRELLKEEGIEGR